MDTAEVIHSGHSQAVRLPEGLHFEGTKVLIKKVDNAVVLSSYRGDWQALFDSLEMFSADFMEEDSESVGRAVPETEQRNV